MNKELFLRGALSLCAAGIMAAACFKSISTGGDTSIRVFMEDNTSVSTRTGETIETGEFILNISSSDGKEIWSGLFKDSPEIFNVSPGSYTVSATSRLFSEPEYDAPVYGDTKVVIAKSGDAINVILNCEMQNCGMKMNADAGFRMAFPDAVIYMRTEEGCLQYNYEESRTAYFNPGKISVSMNHGGSAETLFTRVLDKRQILDIGLSAPVENGESAAGVSIQVDTATERLSEEYIYGHGAGTPQDAMNIFQARGSAGMTGVWVCGYIVGCASSTSKIEFNGPYSKNTNIVIGERETTSDREYCMTVELKSGTIRNALNLSDHPENKGRKILVKGDIVSSYYGLPGLKNISEYSF